ncbi:hypothetical protein [Myroides injenensis]|uniref:hypothetical protein n=1 Tax=Myroides injenensis TaxID=1183151 RepID=UPI00226DF5A1|nr:hypothetical protein [Myroides injenensis]
MKCIYILLAFVLTNVCFAQVGVNTLEPKSDLDVNGSVRLRKLDNEKQYNRSVLTNSEGKIKTLNNEKDAYQMTDVYFKTMSKVIETTKEIASFYDVKNPLLELNLDIDVIIEPNTVSVVFMDYNVPVVVDASSGSYPNYLGVTLVKKSQDMGMPLTEIGEGARKFTIYDVKQKENQDKLISMPITGTAIDITENPSDTRVVVTYSVKGYVERGRGIMYFGGLKDNLAQNENFGHGIFVINVYERTITK